MYIVLGRWPDGRSSISIAPRKEAAIEALSEFGHTTAAELHMLNTFMMDFGFNDKGEQVLNQVGDYLIDEVIAKAYPGLKHVCFEDADLYKHALKKELTRTLKTGMLHRAKTSGFPSRSGQSSHVFLCRWPDSTFSITVGQDLETAVIDVDEFGNADQAEFHHLDSFIADFRPGDHTELALIRIGTTSWSEIIRKAYPSLINMPLDGGEVAKEAVKKEFEREVRTGARPQAISRSARHLQEEMDVAAALANALEQEALRGKMFDDND